MGGGGRPVRVAWRRIRHRRPEGRCADVPGGAESRASRASFAREHLRSSPPRDKFGRCVVLSADQDRGPIFSDLPERFPSSRARIPGRFPPMWRSFRWRSARETAIASLVLAAVAVLSTAEARAGCQHPWLKPAESPGSLTDLRILDPAGHPGGPGRHEPIGPGRSPCARGACSQAPMIPSSSTVPTPRRAETWGMLAPGDSASTGPRAESLPDQGCDSPRHRTVPVERPPR